MALAIAFADGANATSSVTVAVASAADGATRAERDEEDDETAAAGTADDARLCPRLDAPPLAVADADDGDADEGA